MLTLWQQKLFFLRAQLIHGSFKACRAGGICNGVTSTGRKVGHGLHTETQRRWVHLAAFACITSNLSVQIEHHTQIPALLSYCSARFSPLTLNGDECDLIPGWVFTWASNCWRNSESMFLFDQKCLRECSINATVNRFIMQRRDDNHSGPGMDFQRWLMCQSWTSMMFDYFSFSAHWCR